METSLNLSLFQDKRYRYFLSSDHQSEEERHGYMSCLYSILCKIFILPYYLDGRKSEKFPATKNYVLSEQYPAYRKAVTRYIFNTTNLLKPEGSETLSILWKNYLPEWGIFICFTSDNYRSEQSSSVFSFCWDTRINGINKTQKKKERHLSLAIL